MSIYFALRDLGVGVPQVEPTFSQQLQESLVEMVKPRGSLPNSLKLVESLRAMGLSESAKPEKMAALLQCDVVASLRLLSQMSNTYYQRGYEILSVAHAVNIVGMARIPETISDLGGIKSYRAFFLGRAVASVAFQEMIFASVLARKLAILIAPREGFDQLAYALSILSRLGPMLLAYSRPELFSALYLDYLRSSAPSLEKSFRRLSGRNPGDFGADVAKALNLAKRIQIGAPLVNVAPWHKRVWSAEEGRDIRLSISAVFVANRLVSAISDFSGPEALAGMVEDMAQRLNKAPDVLGECLGESLETTVGSLLELGFSPLRLPFYLEQYTEPIVERDGTINSRSIKWPGIAERINSFINELRACFKSRPHEGGFNYLPHAVLSTLRALLHGMNFDYAMFLRYDKNEEALIPAVFLGQRQEGFEEMRRKAIDPNSRYMPDVQAMLQKQAIFSGDPLFDDHYPFAAFPAMSRNEVWGVFYAHKRAVSDAAPLDTQEQVAVIALAEEWHDVPGGFY